MNQTENTTNLPERLDVSDPLAFVERRAAAGKPEMFEFSEVGDHLAGIVTEIEPVDGQFGQFNIISLMGRDNAESRIQATGAVLQRRLSQIRVGDTVGIRRVADGFSPEYQKPYPNFEVTVVATGTAVSKEALPVAEAPELEQGFDDDADY